MISMALFVPARRRTVSIAIAMGAIELRPCEEARSRIRTEPSPNSIVSQAVAQTGESESNTRGLERRIAIVEPPALHGSLSASHHEGHLRQRTMAERSVHDRRQQGCRAGANLPQCSNQPWFLTKGQSPSWAEVTFRSPAVHGANSKVRNSGRSQMRKKAR